MESWNEFQRLNHMAEYQDSIPDTISTTFIILGLTFLFRKKASMNHKYGLDAPLMLSACQNADINHDDIIKWKLFPRYCPFVKGIRRSPVDPHHKGQWHGALSFFICAWTNGWANNRDAGDLRHHGTHYSITVMNMANGCMNISLTEFTLLVMKLEYSGITESISWLEMGIVIMQDKRFCVSHGERFHLPAQPQRE